jgi:hypothetical protein
MDNILSFNDRLTQDQKIERDMRKYNYDPNDEDEREEYWEDLWCENNLDKHEELCLTVTLGGKTFNLKLSMVEE